MTSPKNKKLQSVPSAGKIVVTVFWDEKGVILVNFSLRGKSLWPSLNLSHKKNVCTVLLPDSTRPHTTEAMTRFRWTVLQHPPYSPDLAPSDYHMFGPLEKSVWGHHYASDEALVNTLLQDCRGGRETNLCSHSEVEEEC